MKAVLISNKKLKAWLEARLISHGKIRFTPLWNFLTNYAPRRGHPVNTALAGRLRGQVDGVMDMIVREGKCGLRYRHQDSMKHKRGNHFQWNAFTYDPTLRKGKK